MKILIVGLGSIGTRHLKNLKTIEPSYKFGILRHKSQFEYDVIDTFNTEHSTANFFYNIEDALLWKPTAVIVANPAPMHIKVAQAFVDVGSHLFIEKPFSNTLKGVNELIQKCAKKNLVLMVGYMLHFFEPLMIIKNALEKGSVGTLYSIQLSMGQFLPDWRPLQDYRVGVSARSCLGGGAIFELSHELDCARWLAGEVHSVSAITGKISNLEIDTEDIANILLKFHNGAIGTIHLNMLDHAARRSCRIIGSKGTIIWVREESDRVRLFSVQEKEWTDLRPAGQVERNNMYIDEMIHFLNCIKTQNTPHVAGVDGKKALEIALAAHQSAREKKTILLENLEI